MTTTTTSAAASSQTKPNNQAGSTSVPVLPPRKVTYKLTATSSSNLSVPCAIAVDGTVVSAHAKKPTRIHGKGGTLSVTVKQGQSVSLYLNSDAHPEFRNLPVYRITAGARDAVVHIIEKAGKHSDTDTPVQQFDKDPKVEAAKTADTYTAALTGDIWMRVSHKYTAAEAASRLPAGTSPAVATAVNSIYSGLATSELTVTEPASAGKPARSVKVKFNDSDNPKNNITTYALLADGLPRVHPAGFAALLSAALDNGISSLTVSSCWRPMLGSIAHRAGLGLDVSVLGGTTLNRQELRNAFGGKKPSKTGNNNDADNVTDAEVVAFGEYEKAVAAKKSADAQLDAADKALKAATKSGKAEQKAAAQTNLKAAEEAADEAAVKEDEARNAWNKERDSGEPAHTKNFRVSLLKCACVRQLFDPWFMDDNTHDSKQAAPNMQRGDPKSNERLHAHHLHITVDEPKIL